MAQSLVSAHYNNRSIDATAALRGSVPAAQHNNILRMYIIIHIVEEHIDWGPISNSFSCAPFFSATASYRNFFQVLYLFQILSPTLSLSWLATFVSLSSPLFALYHNLHSSFILCGVAGSLVLQLRVVAPDLGLELDELFGDFVVGPLGQYSQDGEARLVHVDAAAERQPARARALQAKGLPSKDDTMEQRNLKGRGAQSSFCPNVQNEAFFTWFLPKVCFGKAISSVNFRAFGLASGRP